MRPEYWSEHMFWWFMPMFPMMGMIIFIVVVALIFKAIFGRGTPCSKRSDTALDILKQRYAKGEITREEYQRMKDDINR